MATSVSRAGTPVPPEQTLRDFRAWALSLTDDDLAALGIDGSVEEPMRLLRAFARTKGIDL